MAHAGRNDVRHRTSTVVGITAALLLVGCTSTIRIDNGVVGAGSVLTETREVGTDFDRVEVGGGIVLDVTVGPETSVELEAQENLLPILRTEVTGGTLSVRNTENYAATEPVRLTVTVPRLVGVDLSGGSVGTVRALDADVFAVELTGGAELTATGTVRELSLLASGGSRARLEGLGAESAEIEVSGGGDARLAATERVAGDASGGSTVQVTGGASIEVEATGGSDVTTP
jgi:hypothetical protein